MTVNAPPHVMSRRIQTALNWIGTLLTWFTAPFGGGAVALFVWLTFMLLLSILAGGADPTRSGIVLYASLGVIAAIWWLGSWYVFFRHQTIWARVIHFVGCTLCAIPGVPMAFIFLQAAG